jgi:glycosyltransferase involved in cell wall biosynthesis
VKATLDSKSVEDVLIFPSDRFMNIPDFFVEQSKFLKVIALPGPKIIVFYIAAFLDTFVGIKWRSKMLQRTIRRVKPQILHFHEMQHSAYIFNSISDKLSNQNFKRIVSSWGSDLVIYSKIGRSLSRDGARNVNHVEQISQLLGWADVLTAERESEYLDAKRLGFNGEFLAPIYTTVGIKIPGLGLNPGPTPSHRYQLIIKGYQHDAGRALNALEAISRCLEEVKDFQIVLYSASESVKIQAELMAFETGLNIRIVPTVTHRELLSEFGKSRVYVGLSTSDGLSTSMVESMSAGCFPIQSVNSSASHFLTPGESGFIVNPWDIEDIAAKIRIALTDDRLVDSAAAKNLESLKSKYDYEVGVKAIEKLYALEGR